MKRLLTQNAELRRIRVWNWTLPAFAVRLPDGRTLNVCPNAGACRTFCYALNGTYLFPAVRAAHIRNLTLTLDHLDTWEQAMTAECQRLKPAPRDIPGIVPEECDPWVQRWLAAGGPAVRIHDSGDFYNRDYTEAWLRIAAACPDVLFYAYTKEVALFREHVEGRAPENFRWLYSMGGKQDHLIDPDRDRHADVFPTMEAMVERGYLSQDESDLLAVLLPTTRVGITANNIPGFNKRLAGRTFAAAEQDRRAPRHAVTGV